MKLSLEKRKRISEQILAFLYQSFPKQAFTAEVARELARDEEFIKKLLLELKDRGFLIAIKKNEKGDSYIRRIKWQLSPKAYEAYHEKATGI